MLGRTMINDLFIVGCFFFSLSVLLILLRRDTVLRVLSALTYLSVCKDDCAEQSLTYFLGEIYTMKSLS